MIQIFLSYASIDSDDAELVKVKLEEFDIEVWKDSDGGIKVGDNWRAQIESGIKSSDAVLILLTPDSSDSAYVTFEWAYALGMGKPLIPLLWKECEKHPRLEAFQHLDFVSQPRKWDSLRPEELLRVSDIQLESNIEGVWADKFKVDGNPRVALLNIRKVDDHYFIRGNEYDADLNICQSWESDLSRYNPQRRNLEYFFNALRYSDLKKIQGYTEIMFSGTAGAAPTMYNGVFKDFGMARGAPISGRRVANSALFDDEKGQKELAKKQLDEM